MMQQKPDNLKPVIGIIGGTGKLGGWFAGFFESNNFPVLICGKNTELKPRDIAQKSDIVIISVPISETIKVIQEARELLKPSALLCDFTSLKEHPMKEMLKAKCGVTGLHPLFGPLVPNLKNQTIVFCSGRDNRWTRYLKNFFEENGAKIIFTNAETHDRQMALVQALTHFSNIVFARAIQRQRGQILNAYSSPVFRLQNIVAGRVLGGNPELYADMEMENRFFVKALDDYQKEVAALARSVKNKDRKSFVKAFRESAAFMKNFIPVAQAKSTELIALLEHQPTAMKRYKLNTRIKTNSVAYLGPEGTFSHEAASRVFEKSSHYTPCSTITKVFDAVMNRETALGIVPAENSTEGTIQETLDDLVRYPLQITGSYHLPIHLCLAARTADAKKIKTIKSHSQPIAQSRNWLSEHFPDAILEAESSSAKAILSTKDESVAFVVGRHAARQYHLEIIAENIEDKASNITQFYIIAPEENKKIARQLKARRTLLALAIYDRPGVLRNILSSFADKKLNLSKLYSRPGANLGETKWDYYFFLEVESLPDDKRLKSALEEIKNHCSIVRVLGTT